MTIKKHFSVYKGLPKDLYILFASRVINSMGSFIMPLIALILTQKIGYSKSEAGQFTTLAIMSQAPFLMLGGKLADKIGSKKTIVLFDTLGAMAYIVCGFLKPNLSVAILIIVASDFYAIASPSFNTIIAELTPEPLIKNAYSLVYLGYNLGLTIGPALGGLLFVSHLNLLFILDALTTLLSTLLILLKVHKRKTSEIPVPPEESAASQAPASVSLLSFLLRNPILVIFSAVLLIYHFCYIQWSFMLPMQTVHVFGESGVRFYSLLVSLNAITVIVATPLLTSLTHKLPALKSIFFGGLLYCLSFALFAVNRFAAIFILSIVVMTVGESLISINTSSYVAERTIKSHIGRVNSVVTIVTGCGYALGPIAMGSLLMTFNFRIAWLAVSALMLCAAFIMYIAGRKDRRKAAFTETAGLTKN